MKSIPASDTDRLDIGTVDYINNPSTSSAPRRVTQRHSNKQWDSDMDGHALTRQTRRLIRLVTATSSEPIHDQQRPAPKERNGSEESNERRHRMICTCIRDVRDMRLIAIPDIDCPRHQ
jgi:hypothetical protein